MQEDGDLRYYLNNRRKFDVRAVLVLLYHGKVFVGQDDTRSELYILPGGAIKFNEASQQAAKREAREELGLKDLHLDFAGILENFWKLKQVTYHQLNLVYRQEVSEQIYQQLENLDYQKFDLPPNSDLKWVKTTQIVNSLQPSGIVKMCYPDVKIQHLVNHQTSDF